MCVVSLQLSWDVCVVSLQLSWLTTAPEWEALDWSSNPPLASSSSFNLSDNSSVSSLGGKSSRSGVWAVGAWGWWRRIWCCCCHACDVSCYLFCGLPFLFLFLFLLSFFFLFRFFLFFFFLFLLHYCCLFVFFNCGLVPVCVNCVHRLFERRQCIRECRDPSGQLGAEAALDGRVGVRVGRVGVGVGRVVGLPQCCCRHLFAWKAESFAWQATDDLCWCRWACRSSAYSCLVAQGDGRINHSR